MPKTLPQWYNKLKNTQKVSLNDELHLIADHYFPSLQKHFSLSNKGYQNAYEKFLDFLRLIDEENPENKSDAEHRKINLFVQMRYDEVPEHEEEEQDPACQPYKHFVPEPPKLIAQEEG